MKLRLYARAGIKQYVVVDLVHDTVLDHRTLRGEAYHEVTSLHAGDSVDLAAGEQALEVAVGQFLP